MRKLYFLLPGTKGKFGGGGLWAELKTIKLAQKVCDAELVTYRQKEDSHLFLPELLKQPHLQDCIFVVSWGFDVPKLVKQLKEYNIIYHAHSAGYGFSLAPDIPIITVSRNTMGYWGQKSPNSLIYYLPNQIGEEFVNLGKERDIDVLVQERKSSEYLLTKLVPALKKHCHVEVINSYVEDLAGLFNRAKIYLYDSAEYWAVSGVTEGFGLPPLEALSCGCQVFSSVNSALADYLDPSFNCYKISGYSTEYDLQRILRCLKSDFQPLNSSFFAEYKEDNLVEKLTLIMREVNDFFNHRKLYQSDIKGVNWWRLRQLWLGRIFGKFKKKFL